jgi:hypothetical protein
MWLMALLINSNTLEEMSIIWRNMCIVLLSPSQNDQFKISISTLSKMDDNMNKDKHPHRRQYMFVRKQDRER